MLAAIYANYRPDELAGKSLEDRAMIIALYRTKLQSDAVVAQDQAKQIERRNRRQQRRRR